MATQTSYTQTVGDLVASTLQNVRQVNWFIVKWRIVPSEVPSASCRARPATRSVIIFLSASYCATAS